MAMENEDEIIDEEVVEDAEAEETEEVEADAEAKPETTEEDEDPEIEIPTIGKRKLSEVQKGYMMHADYTRKTMALAEQKRELDRQFALLNERKSSVPAKETTEEDELAEYDPKDIERLDKIMRSRGYVRKEDLEQVDRKRAETTILEQKRSTVSDFESRHPEYSPENDPTGVRASMLKEALSMYNVNDVKNLAKILEKAHLDASESYNAAYAKSRSAVAKKNVKAASIGSSSGGGTSKPASQDEEYTEEQLAVLRENGLLD